MADTPQFMNEQDYSLHINRSISSGAMVEPLKLGERVKQLRLSQKLTLEEAAQRTGLARSTLSKIENEQVSPTFAVVSKLVAGLGIDIPQLFTQPEPEQVGGGRRDITRAADAIVHPTKTYEHELHATQLSSKKMIPFKTRVHARSFEEYDQWVRHGGEEFLYVLAGEVMLYTEFYAPVALKEGDSAYYDCTMGHALVSLSEADAEVLWVTA